MAARGSLRPLEVHSFHERLDAWVLDLLPEDKNVVDVLEQGLADGSIAIPGGDPSQPDGFESVANVTSYLNTFGVTVADRIRDQFQPLFDPASEPLSEEVLAVNDYIQSKAGYSLYDAQLAVAESVKRQLDRKSAALIIAECGSGKTKIGSTALGALYGMWASQRRKGMGKTFSIVMSPSHVTQKWVREIGETLPDTYAMVVRSVTDLNRLYAMYEAGDKSVFAVLSKEKARDGYMRYPAVTWNRRRNTFLCPDCMEPIEMEISEDGTESAIRYNANSKLCKEPDFANHFDPSGHRKGEPRINRNSSFCVVTTLTEIMRGSLEWIVKPIPEDQIKIPSPCQGGGWAFVIYWLYRWCGCPVEYRQRVSFAYIFPPSAGIKSNC